MRRRITLAGVWIFSVMAMASHALALESPTESYEAFYRALRMLDMETLRVRWLPDRSVNENEATFTKEVLRLRQVTPPEVQVEGEKIIGEDAFLSVVGYYPNGGISKGKIFLIKDIDQWKVKGERWGFIEFPPPAKIPKGKGIIEGIITLPKVQKSGNLYVFAVLENQTFPIGYTQVPKDQIIWDVVPYQINQLPQGTYWVYAYWDTAPPYMSLEKKDFAVYTGDYAGEFSTTVTLFEGEKRSRIDFSCQRDLKARDEENYGNRYAFVDLGMSRDNRGNPIFLLSIRNVGFKPIRSISLVCLINGKQLEFSASSPGTLILPREVRTFDITTCYESYLFFLDKIWADENLSEDALRFEIVSEDNDARFKKEILLQ